MCCTHQHYYSATRYNVVINIEGFPLNLQACVMFNLRGMDEERVEGELLYFGLTAPLFSFIRDALLLIWS